MFSTVLPGWSLGWSWGWGWAAAVGGILLLGIFLLPWFFFLLNLQTTLNRVNDRNRAMPAGQVWLNFIPVFNLGWFIYTVTKVRDSARNEYQSRGWAPDGDFGYNVGLTTGILAIASFFIGWVPVIGWGIGLALLVCWIIYWLKMSDLKNRLGQPATWQGVAAPYGYSRPAAPPATAAAPTATAPPAVDAAGKPGSDSSPGKEKIGGQCAVCGAGFDPGDQFCRTCGLRLP